MSRSPSTLRQTIVGAGSARRTAGQSDDGSAWATEPPIVPQLRTCGSPMPPAVSCMIGRTARVSSCLLDLAMGDAAADADAVVGADDVGRGRRRPQVDEHGRLREPQFQEWQQAVAAGQQLRVALAVREDLQRLVQAARTDVVELARNHCAAVPPPRRVRDSVAHRWGRRAWSDDERADDRRRVRASICGPWRVRAASIRPRRCAVNRGTTRIAPRFSEAAPGAPAGRGRRPPRRPDFRHDRPLATATCRREPEKPPLSRHAVGKRRCGC